MDVEQSRNPDLCNGKHWQGIQQVLGKIRPFHYTPVDQSEDVDMENMTVNKLNIVAPVLRQDYIQVVQVEVEDSMVDSVESVHVVHSEQK